MSILGLLSCFFFGSNSSIQPCDPNDLLALREFAGNLTKGPLSQPGTRLLICCQWDGVVCENVNNGTVASRVTQLILPSRSLKGWIACRALKLDAPGSALSGLKSIKVLNISSNSIQGNLSELGGFPHLVGFNISNNSFTGQFNPQLCSSSNEAQILDISWNRLTGSLEGLDNCSSFGAAFSLWESLSGPISKELSSIDLNFTGLPNLCTLDLATNHFSGFLPNSLSYCRELKTLSLARNEFRGSIPEDFSKLTSLFFLSLSNNSFVNLLGHSLCCSSAKSHDSYSYKNFLGEEIPKNGSGFESLMVLALGNCALKGQIPVWLLSCRKLQVLDLSWNQLDGSIPPWIVIQILLHLLASRCLLNEIRVLVACQYNQASNFLLQYLSNNRINGTIWPEIGRLKELHALDWSRNNITGTIPSSISEMENLETLDLSFNDLHGSIPPSLSKLTFLSKFSVANNHLHG
ncbi:phytosulfokine receptor 2 [Prunus yedoensis var. nudiflora]|uniref:Phytosulfokine receptor 2 n=1 Tax=Prunus yedoensis var. nudiflora TaxID=2094558 RepID=A0A314UFU0_PRUYE|nr:phytosulfokine receptor 2 [Prunus yedoensis var. nudiflora]